MLVGGSEAGDGLSGPAGSCRASVNSPGEVSEGEPVCTVRARSGSEARAAPDSPTRRLGSAGAQSPLCRQELPGPLRSRGVVSFSAASTGSASSFSSGCRVTRTGRSPDNEPSSACRTSCSSRPKATREAGLVRSPFMLPLKNGSSQRQISSTVRIAKKVIPTCTTSSNAWPTAPNHPPRASAIAWMAWIASATTTSKPTA
ncbi:hypothetical protein GCM10027456_12980 [Kineosporia babensis]